jgi:hypothetical protein
MSTTSTPRTPQGRRGRTDRLPVWRIGLTGRVAGILCCVGPTVLVLAAARCTRYRCDHLHRLVRTDALAGHLRLTGAGSAAEGAQGILDGTVEGRVGVDRLLQELGGDLSAHGDDERAEHFPTGGCH